MNSSLTTLDPIPAPLSAKTILAQGGFTGSLLTLAPGDEAPQSPAASGETLLFVIGGEVTVRCDDVSTIVGPHEALLLPKGKEPVLVAHPGGEAKLLRITVPPRPDSAPIVAFER